MPARAATTFWLAAIAGILCGASSPQVGGQAPAKTAALQPGPGLNDGSDDGSAARGKDTMLHGAFTAVDFSKRESMAAVQSTCNPHSAVSLIPRRIA